jgi:hypothetical protein
MRYFNFDLFSRLALLFCSIFIVGQVTRYLVGLLFK